MKWSFLVIELKSKGHPERNAVGIVERGWVGVGRGSAGAAVQPGSSRLAATSAQRTAADQARARMVWGLG